MTSLLTNNAAMTALTTLKSINTQLDMTSNRVSTGQRVSSAADNAAYWSIATTVRTDNASLGAVKDSLGLGSSAVDTAYNGLNSAISDLQNMRAKLQTALQPGVDDDAIYDGNSYLLAAAARRTGAVPYRVGLVPDEPGIAEMEGMDVGDADMADMPCCPPGKAAKPDCAKAGCPLLALCLASVASLLPTAASVPAPVATRTSRVWPDAASFASLSGRPLPEPPRA